MKYLLIGIVRLYQLMISPFLTGHCRFYPSCSQYSIEAFRKHGSFKGLWLTIKRISHCHPWGEGGYDPVPEPKSK
jgi:putative membrane protein insertion efficiency factor